MTLLKQNIKAVLRRTLPPLRGNAALCNCVRRFRERAYKAPIASSPLFFSQDGQDQAVVGLFCGRRNGIFLDIGAHDGISFSNTCYLERQLGWTGICIEPHPDVFERLQLNRSCMCENAAIGLCSGTARFTCVSGYGEMLSRLSTGGASERVAQVVREKGCVAREVDVPCRRISAILMRYEIHKVDYLSMDIEGGEYDILRDIDLRQLGVSVLTVENNYADDRIELHLRRLGYRLIRILGSDGMYALAGAVK